MSSVGTATDPAYSDECGMQYLATELKLEICGYLEVHDQLAMRKVCAGWRSDLSDMRQSGYVDIDISRIPEQSQKRVFTAPKTDLTDGDDEAAQQYVESLMDAYLTLPETHLEHALNRHLHKNTKILILRRVDFERNQFGIVAKVIKAKGAELIQLILKDCTEEAGFAAPTVSIHGLIPAAERLILDNHTLRNVLQDIFVMPELMPALTMLPCSINIIQRFQAGNMLKPLPIVLPHHEFDRSQPLDQHYRSFIMALDANCPEVSPKVRDDVVELYKWWKQTPALPFEWRRLGMLITSLNEGVRVPGGKLPALQLEPLALEPTLPPQQLDPLTLNKLTMETLHRAFCLAEQEVSPGGELD